MLIFLAILIIVCGILAIYAMTKLYNGYKTVLCEYDIVVTELDGKNKSLAIKEREIQCLKKELAMLQEERKVAKTENVKVVEELPKKEKVAKPRAKKTTKTTKTTKK